MPGALLSERDQQRLSALLAWWERTHRTSPRSDAPPDDHQAPEVYVARTPSGGIPGLTEETGTPFGDDEPGQALCQIYQVIRGDTLSLAEVGYLVPVLNLSSSAVPGSTWVPVVREKYGAWICVGGGTGGTSLVTDVVTEVCPIFEDIVLGTDDLADGAVAYAKIQDVAAERLLGNPTGSPATVMEIPLGTGLAFVAGALVATGEAAIADGDYGDITVSGSGTGTGTGMVWTIDDEAVTSDKIADNAVGTQHYADGSIVNAALAAFAVETVNILAANVTYAKIQDVAGARLLGNSTGAPATVAEIPLGTGLEFDTGALRIADGGVDTTQLADEAVTFAKIQDMPQQTLLGRVGVGSGPPEAISPYASIAIGSGIILLLNDDPAPGNDKYYGTDSGGTKGWHDLPGMPVGPTNGGTGLTSYATGDIIYAHATDALAKLGGNLSTTKKFLRSTGTGSAATAPAWDTLVAGDIPAHSTALLTSGTLGVARGGTGIAAYSLGDLLYGASGAAINQLGGNITTTPKVLQQTGTGSVSAAPVWTAWPGADSQSNVLGSAFAITAATGTWEATGITITLPSAGTYILIASVQGEINYTAGGSGEILARMYNSSDSATIGFDFSVVYEPTTSRTQKGSVVASTKQTFAASKTIIVQVTSLGGTTWATRSIRHGSTLTAIKVSP